MNARLADVWFRLRADDCELPCQRLQADIGGFVPDGAGRGQLGRLAGDQHAGAVGESGESELPGPKPYLTNPP